MITNINDNIIIAMATYNGEQYIREQIESIINQSYKNWKLIVQDDGSKDSTVNIISEYVSQDDRILLITNDSDNHGAYANFYSLLSKIQSGTFGSNYQYVALSDQDDIWLDNKLEILIESIHNSNEYGPILVYSDYSIINAYGDTLINSAHSEINLVPNRKESIFFSNSYVWGNTTLLNRELLERVHFSDNLINNKYPHDAFLAKVATIVGSLVFVDSQLVKYRRFENNESAGMWYRLSFSKIVNKLKIRTRAKTLGVTLDQSLAILKNYNSDKNQNIIQAIKKGGIKGTWYLCTHKVWKKQLVRSMAIYITMMSNTYKEWLNE